MRVLTIVVIFFLSVGNAWGDVQYTLKDIGSLGGEGVTYAEGFNNNGQIVGASTNKSGQRDAFLYGDGVMQDLGTLGGTSVSGAPSLALGINSSGTVVGWSYEPGSITYHAFLYSGGSMQNLEACLQPPMFMSIAASINDSGQVAGYAKPWGMSSGAFVYSAGSTQFLLDGKYAWGINNSGQVVGQTNNNHAFFYSGGSTQDLGTLGGTSSSAYSINDGGQVVGESDLSDGSEHAFLWQGGSGMQDLGTLGGTSSVAFSINKSGQVVGYSETSSGVDDAFIYSNGSMTDLNNLIPPSVCSLSQFFNGGLQSGIYINDGGQIVAAGDNGHVYLLTPIPEPSTLILFGAGVISLLAYAWRRRWTA